MLPTFPEDIKVEYLLNFFPREQRKVDLLGSHQRNAYEDIMAVYEESDGRLRFSVGRNGIYDILPESLFHPIDRFEGIPANVYKERVRDEIEQQQIEEDNARGFFRPFDRFLLELSGIVSQVKESFSDSNVIADIITDSLSETYLSNRFVIRTKPFLAYCRDIRGDKILIALMLRKVLLEEGIYLNLKLERQEIKDKEPQYKTNLDDKEEGNRFYLGNEFEEEIEIFNILYWNNKECSDKFMDFIDEIKVYEKFINDFFVGIESKIRFEIRTETLPVRLSDNICHNYLNYNTNL